MQKLKHQDHSAVLRNGNVYIIKGEGFLAYPALTVIQCDNDRVYFRYSGWFGSPTQQSPIMIRNRRSFELSIKKGVLRYEETK